MAFQWTYPDPLDPNQPSLIGGKLRNVIPSLTVYITEIQDAINTLRESVGQTAWNWSLRPSVGDTLYYNHFLNLQQKIDILITDFGYNSSSKSINICPHSLPIPHVAIAAGAKPKGCVTLPIFP